MSVESWLVEQRHQAVLLLGGAAGAVDAVRAGRSVRTGSRNGVFVAAEDLRRPAGEITPVATIVGLGCRPGGSPIDPVDWKVLAEDGVAVRGPAPGELGLDPEPDRLGERNRGNLESYWRPWARRVADAPWQHVARSGYAPSWHVAWGALGAPRLHHTIATGEVVSKEVAGCYALGVFDERWHPLVRRALAYRHRAHTRRPVRHGAEELRLTAAFVTEVVESARALTPARPHR